MRKYFLILLVFALYVTIGHPCQAEVPLNLNKVELSRKHFNPSHKEALKLSFEPNQAADAVVRIYNDLGDLVATPFSGKVRKATKNVNWKGTDDSGHVLPAGTYYYTIQLKNKSKTVTHNPYPQSHGQLLSILEGGYDEKNNQIYFKLPQAAMVRVRINLSKGGPIIATPLDWTALTAGDYRFPWNGKDADNLVDIKTHPNRNIMIYAYTLADNSIIVDGIPTKPDGVFTVLNESMMAQKEFPLNLPADRYMHARKDPRLNRMARIQVDFPDSKIENGLPVLRGKSPIRVSIDPRDQWMAELSRYELMFYIDTVVVFEDESGFTPFTYIFDTKGVSAGEHVLTVNLLTYDDHYAVISKKVLIQHESDDEKNV